MPTTRCWATRIEAAEHVHVSPDTIDNWVEKGLVRAYRVGARVVRYDLFEIDAMLTTTQEATRH